MKLLLTTIFIALLTITGSAFAGQDKVKAGFIYVGPTGDHGWTYRHDIGRQDVEKHFGDRVETMFVESVKYGPDAERVMRQMAMTVLSLQIKGMVSITQQHRPTLGAAARS